MHFDSFERVLMARAEGTLTLADLIGINADAARFVARESLVRFLLALSAVDTVDIPTPLFVDRAQRTAVLPMEERVYVAPNPVIYGMCRMFASHQANAGDLEPLVVGSLSEAYETLGLVDPDFQPLQGPSPH